MSSKFSDAKRFAYLLREIADRLEDDPKFLEELMPNKTQRKANASDFDLLFAIHEYGIESVRHQLAEMDIRELKILVAKNRFDTTGKVRKWKQKERIVDFLLDAVSRRADFGSSIFPASPERRDTERNTHDDN